MSSGHDAPALSESKRSGTVTDPPTKPAAAINQMLQERIKKDVLNYHFTLIAWNLDGAAPPPKLIGMDLKANCEVYAFSLSGCRHVAEFEEVVRDIIGTKKEYTCYTKSMGKTPHIASLMIFVQTSLILERNWQCLEGSVKSKKWAVRRGTKTIFGTRSSERGALSMAFHFKKTVNLAFVGLNLPNQPGELLEADEKRGHDVNRILTKLPFELVRRRRNDGERTSEMSNSNTDDRGSSMSTKGGKSNSTSKSTSAYGSMRASSTGSESVKRKKEKKDKKVKHKHLYIDHVLMFGSMRYPMESNKIETLSQASKAIEEGRQQQWAVLMRRDTLTNALKRDAVYRGFEEPALRCLPTSPKVRTKDGSSEEQDTTTNTTNTNNRQDVVSSLMAQYLDEPSYPERILHQSSPVKANQLTSLEYASRSIANTVGKHDPIVNVLLVAIKENTVSGVTPWQRMSGNIPRSLLSPSPMASTLAMDPYFHDILRDSLVDCTGTQNMPMQGYWQSISGNVSDQYMSFWNPESLVKMSFFSLVRPYLDSDHDLTVFARLFDLKTFKKGELLFEEGDEGGDDGLYIVLRGGVDVWKKKKNNGGNESGRGNTLNHETLAKRGDWYTAQYTALVDLLVNDEFEMHLCHVVAHTAKGHILNDIVRALVVLFESRSKAMLLMQFAIDEEIELHSKTKAHTLTTLFRRNSFSTSCLKTYSRLVGTHYLKEVLREIILKVMVANKNTNHFELFRQDQISRQRHLAKTSKLNQHRLMHVCDDIFTSIVSSISRAPRQLKEICCMLKNKIVENYGGGNGSDKETCIRVSVGGFIFLRYLCPAIIAPEEAGILNPEDGTPTTTARRSLLLISKIIQKLANGTRFKAELNPHLTNLNGWLEFHDDSMLDMCEKWAEATYVPETMIVHGAFDWNDLHATKEEQGGGGGSGNSGQWYCVKSSPKETQNIKNEANTAGPMSVNEMKLLYEQGLIDGMSLVWSPTLPNRKWVTLARVTSGIFESEPESDTVHEYNGTLDVDGTESTATTNTTNTTTTTTPTTAPATSPTAASAEPPLLEVDHHLDAWETCVDPKTSHYYEFNKTTSETRWCVTEGEWIKLTGSSGTPYYMHATTHATQWKCPDGLFVANTVEGNGAAAAGAASDAAAGDLPTENTPVVRRSRHRSLWTRYTTEEGKDFLVDNDKPNSSQWEQPQSFFPTTSDAVLSSAQKKLHKRIITREEYDQIVKSQKMHDLMMNGGEMEHGSGDDAQVEQEIQEQHNDNQKDTATPDAENEKWQMFHDSQGRLYYHNKRTELSQWNKPESFHLEDMTDTFHTSTPPEPPSTMATKATTKATHLSARMSRIQKYLEKKRMLEAKKKHVEKVVQDTLLPRQNRAFLDSGPNTGRGKHASSTNTMEFVVPDAAASTATPPAKPPKIKRQYSDSMSRGVNEAKVYSAIMMLHGFLNDHSGHIRRQIIHTGMMKRKSQSKQDFTFAETFSMLLNRLGSPNNSAQSDATLLHMQHLQPMKKKKPSLSSKGTPKGNANGNSKGRHRTSTRTSVTELDAQRGQQAKLATLRQGTFFGEIALFSSTIRTATVTASTETQTLSLNAETLSKFLHHVPQLLEPIQDLVKQRTSNSMKNLSFFQNLTDADDSALNLLGDLFHFKQYVEGAVIFNEGDHSEDGLYVIVHGSLEVRSIRSDGTSTLLTVLDEGVPFGEVALLNDSRRTATVIACEDCVLLNLPRSSWRSFLSTVPQSSSWFASIVQSRTAHQLKTMPLFDAIQIQFDTKIMEIAQYFRYQSAESKETIIVENEVPDDFYILVTGKVEVCQQGQRLKELVGGDYFGEVALLNGGGGLRTATVKTLTDCTLMCCTAEDFQTVLRVVPEFVRHFQLGRDGYVGAEERGEEKT